MAIGIRLSENVSADLQEIKEKFLRDLDDNNIKYEIPFDKLNKNNVKETIIHIKDLDMEISIENDIITYIKSGNTEFTHLDKIEDIETSPLDHIKTIQEHIKNAFDTSGYSLKLEKIDTKTMNMTIILSSSKHKARVQVIRDSFGDVYINTLRSL